MKVKTVVIVNDFNYTQGGASKVAIDTARLLKESNMNVIFFSAVSKDDEKIDGIKYITTNQNEALKEKNKLKGIINGIYNFKAKKEFKKLLKTLDKNSTIIHVHGWTKALSSSIFDIAFKMKFKVVLTLHDYFTACPNGGYFNYKKNKICHLKPLSWKCIKCNCDSRNYAFKLYRVIRQFVQNKIVRLNDKLTDVISISNFSEKILKETLNKNIQIHRVYNPIELDNNLKQADYKKNDYFLYVGRVSREKGVDIFCKVITKTNQKGIVVGAGSELNKLKNIYPNINFVGWKNRDEVKGYMKGAKCLIFPSRCYETMGLTVIEAINLKVPVIANINTAASDFIIDNKNGFLYDSEEQLVEYIKTINQLNFTDNDKELLKFSIDSFMGGLIKTYNLINKK